MSDIRQTEVQDIVALQLDLARDNKEHDDSGFHESGVQVIPYNSKHPFTSVVYPDGATYDVIVVRRR